MRCATFLRRERGESFQAISSAAHRGSHDLRREPLCTPTSECRRWLCRPRCYVRIVLSWPDEPTPKEHRLIVEYASEGLPEDVCFNLAGVDPRVGRGWLSEADDWDNPEPNKRCVAFARDLRRAQAEAERDITMPLVDAARAGDPVSARFLLERRFGENWRRR